MEYLTRVFSFFFLLFLTGIHARAKIVSCNKNKTEQNKKPSLCVAYPRASPRERRFLHALVWSRTRISLEKIVPCLSDYKNVIDMVLLFCCNSRSVQRSSLRHYYIHLLKKTWEAWKQVSGYPVLRSNCWIFFRITRYFVVK